ncbi:hypothetical protein HDU83_004080, partial [Entophlyctis luteolus]
MVSGSTNASAACWTSYAVNGSYPGGSQVSYNGFNWQNKWWENPGWVPGAAGGDGGWVLQAPCGMQSDACWAAWQANVTYPQYSQVSYNGSNWQAKWSENSMPAPEEAGTDGGWELQGSCVGGSTAAPATSNATQTTTAPSSAASTAASASNDTCWTPYSVTGSYPGGSQVSYNGFNWQNKWWENPGWVPGAAGGDGGWVLQGSCGVQSSTCWVPWLNAIYPQYSQVSYNGFNWQAQFAENNMPAPGTNGSDGGWVSQGACVASTGTTATQTPTATGAPVSTKPTALATLPTSVTECFPDFTTNPLSGIAYNKGDFASYQGVNYIAAVATPTGTPGVSNDWTVRGACTDGKFTYRPFTTPGVVGFWTQWSPYSRKQNFISNLDLTGFTAINYAFVNVLANGTLASFDTWADFNWIRTFTAQRYYYPGLKTIASIGGWSGSRTFSTVAASSELTAVFAKSVHEFLDTYGFDGVDLDWEYPGGGGLSCNVVSPDDAKNYATLLQALRDELGADRTISIDVSAEVGRYTSNGVSYAQKYSEIVSYVAIMTYDLYGASSPYSDFHSALNSPGPNDPVEPAANSASYSRPLSITAGISEWRNAGVSSSNLIAGLAFYGHSWQVSSEANNGLYQLCLGSVNGTACPAIVGDFLDAQASTDVCGGTSFSGIWMYMNIRGANNLPNNNFQTSPPLPNSNTTVAGNGWTREYFEFAQMSTLYTDNYLGEPTFLAYDDPTSIYTKSAYLKSAVGGVMVWELSQDYNAELTHALVSGWESGLTPVLTTPTTASTSVDTTAEVINTFAVTATAFHGTPAAETVGPLSSATGAANVYVAISAATNPPISATTSSNTPAAVTGVMIQNSAPAFVSARFLAVAG